MTTPPFKVSSAHYMRVMWTLLLRQCWPWAALTVTAAAALSLIDLRCLLATLLVMAAAVPMALALLYINYALSAEARWSLLEKTMTVAPDGVTLRFSDERMHTHVIPWTETGRLVELENHVLLMLSVRRFTFIMIPRTALSPALLSLLRQKNAP